MKLKHYTFILFLLFVTSTIYSQSQKKIYEVTIFKWVKSENKELKKYITIDSIGNILLLNKSTGKKVNLKSFTKSINLFITEASVEKVPGSDDPPRNAFEPKNEEQNIYITISFLEDYHKEINLGTMTSYQYKKLGLKVSDKEYIIYKYLEKSDSSLLKKFLE